MHPEGFYIKIFFKVITQNQVLAVAYWLLFYQTVTVAKTKL